MSKPNGLVIVFYDMVYITSVYKCPINSNNITVTLEKGLKKIIQNQDLTLTFKKFLNRWSNYSVCVHCTDKTNFTNLTQKLYTRSRSTSALPTN